FHRRVAQTVTQSNVCRHGQASSRPFGGIGWHFERVSGVPSSLSGSVDRLDAMGEAIATPRDGGSDARSSGGCDHSLHLLYRGRARKRVVSTAELVVQKIAI